MGKRVWEKKKIMTEIVATASLPVDCLTATNNNAANCTNRPFTHAIRTDSIYF